MFSSLILLITVKLAVATLKFPPNFKFGVATAAYQIEGGWNASGKGESIWDRLTHSHPERILDHRNGDVACNSYNLWREDVALLRDLGVDHYRFSLSWTRILPTGFPNKINQDGVNYYNGLINELIKNGIEPMVTLYHWDLPQNLQDLGGWTNPDIAKYFRSFAKVAFQLFGDRVKTWITINEPNSICLAVYETGKYAPDVKLPGIGLYLCGKTILLAHALAYRLYDQEFREHQKGKIGITIDSIWAEPLTNTTKDIDAAEREMQMSFGWWTNPIFSAEGDYPAIMIKRINALSEKENFAQSRLPPLTKSQVKLIQGTFDFLGLNHYHTWLISDKEYPVSNPPSNLKDKGTVGTQDPNWKPSPKIVPWGFRKLMNWVKTHYNNPLVIITENGYEDTNADLEDNDRVLFLKEYLKAVLQAIWEDGCNVKAYTFWSIMDNMEWIYGYTRKFGLYNVDFSSLNRTRTARRSASFYKTIIKTRTLPKKGNDFIS